MVHVGGGGGGGGGGVIPLIRHPFLFTHSRSYHIKATDVLRFILCTNVNIIFSVFFLTFTWNRLE